jgi:hypothetical protein
MMGNDPGVDVIDRADVTAKDVGKPGQERIAQGPAQPLDLMRDPIGRLQVLVDRGP